MSQSMAGMVVSRPTARISLLLYTRQGTADGVEQSEVMTHQALAYPTGTLHRMCAPAGTQSPASADKDLQSDLQEAPMTVYIGIDWSQLKHDRARSRRITSRSASDSVPDGAPASTARPNSERASALRSSV